MHGRFTAGVAIAVLGFWGQAASAAPAVVACHGCSSERAKRVAEAQVPMSAPAGVYDVYVVNTPGRVLWRYLVTAEREHGLRENFAHRRKPAVTYARAFSDWQAAWVGIRDQFKSSVRLPDDFPIRSVTEVFLSRANQSTVSRALNRDVFVWIGALAGSALQTIGEVVFSAKVHATVEFPDGSTGTFDLVGVHSPTSGLEMFRFDYRKGSARDSEGNAIPDRLRAFDGHEGHYTVRGNLNQLLQMIRLFDVGLREQPSLPATVVCVRSQHERYCWVRKR